MGHAGQTDKLKETDPLYALRHSAEGGWKPRVYLNFARMAGVIGMCVVTPQPAPATEEPPEPQQPSLAIVVEAPEELKPQIEQALTRGANATPQLEYKGGPMPPIANPPLEAQGHLRLRTERSRLNDQGASLPWRIQIVKPNERFDYKVVQVFPSGNTEYHIQAIDPKTWQEDVELSETLRRILPRLLEEQKRSDAGKETTSDEPPNSKGKQ